MDVLESQRPQLHADIDAAAAALRLAEIELENTAIRSPSDGWVGERQARFGQYLRPGTLLLAIVPEDVWVVANFKETQISDLHIGDSVSVRRHPRQRFQGPFRRASLRPAARNLHPCRPITRLATSHASSSVFRSRSPLIPVRRVSKT